MNFQNLIIGIVLFSAVMVGLGHVMVSIGEEYPNPVTEETNISGGFNKINDMRVLEEQMRTKIEGNTSIKEAGTIDLLWGGAWGSIKLIFKSLGTTQELTVEALDVLGAEDPGGEKMFWLTIITTIISISIIFGILYLVFGRKPGG